ncbi:hypothetical protein [Conexibacter woesei]|uniref:Uncharacterized protein n=1 Tax=Conexibacter woesei (strain DSM 14684 / CCUG 47730 / CIP 108061 / JCM 11494 / NBRC 100937 / ID131577) TaxID=469383 RepID=D3FF14_CONWI|nr:hypothetical protein [Conexibacter woesei]ADB51731.1 hypothetical protein Cwoe_3313 [Conexibacter woesei DSM 14684]
MHAIVLLATEVALLPERVDASFVLVASGLGGLLGSIVAVICGLELDRLARVSLFGTIVGATIGAVAFFVLLVLH